MIADVINKLALVNATLLFTFEAFVLPDWITILMKTWPAFSTRLSALNSRLVTKYIFLRSIEILFQNHELIAN